MAKKIFALLLTAVVLYGCGGANGTGGFSSEGTPYEGPDPEPVSTVQVRMANVDLTTGTLDVFMSNEDPVGGFEFSIGGVTVTGATNEVPGHAGDFYVDSSESHLSGYSLSGYSIAPGDRLLTRISFSDYQFNGISFADTGACFITDPSGYEMPSKWIDGTDVYISTNTPTLTEVSPGSYAGTLDVYMDNETEVFGFQFVLGGDITVTGASEGSAINDYGFYVDSSDEMVLGFTISGNGIEVSQERLLIRVQIESAIPNPEIHFDWMAGKCVIADPGGYELVTEWVDGPLSE